MTASRSCLRLLFVLLVPTSCTEAGDGDATAQATTYSPTPSQSSPLPGGASGAPNTHSSNSAVPDNSIAGAGGDGTDSNITPDDTSGGNASGESSDTAGDSTTAAGDSSEPQSDSAETQGDAGDAASNSDDSSGAAGAAETGNAGQGGASSGGSDGGGPNPNAGGSAGASNGGLSAFRLAVIGSSTSAGEGASSESNGWVSLLAAALEETVQVPFSSDNLSVGGYASPNLLPDSGSNGNIDEAIDTEPNLIIVALAGSNDLSAGTSQATFIERMHTLRDTALDAGIPLFFVSTAPKDLSDDEQQALRDWSDAMAAEFTSCWVPGSAAYSPCFIDTFDALANDSLGIDSMYSAGDGIHLNDAGHVVIFEAARAVVEAYVCTQVMCL